MTLFETPTDNRPLTGQLMWFGLWAAATVIGLFLHPDVHGHGTHQQLGFPPCPSVLLFDRPCPGCGLTTSWSALLHGNFVLAFHAHPLGPVLYAMFTLTAFLALYAWIRKVRLVADSPQVGRILTIAGVAFLLFGAARMALSPGFATKYERVMAGRQP